MAFKAFEYLLGFSANVDHELGASEETFPALHQRAKNTLPHLLLSSVFKMTNDSSDPLPSCL